MVLQVPRRVCSCSRRISAAAAKPVPPSTARADHEHEDNQEPVVPERKDKFGVYSNDDDVLYCATGNCPIEG